jgi:hypothetical protein
MAYVTLEAPVSLTVWWKTVHTALPDTTLHTAAVFEGPVKVSARLDEIIAELGPQGGLNAVFAVSNGWVEGVWFDPFHNFIALRFRKACGDEHDEDSVMSFGSESRSGETPDPAPLEGTSTEADGQPVAKGSGFERMLRLLEAARPNAEEVKQEDRYEELARALQGLFPAAESSNGHKNRPDTWNQFFAELERVLIRNDPHFDRDRFYAAVGWGSWD